MFAGGNLRRRSQQRLLEQEGWRAAPIKLHGQQAAGAIQQVKLSAPGPEQEIVEPTRKLELRDARLAKRKICFGLIELPDHQALVMVFRHGQSVLGCMHPNLAVDSQCKPVVGEQRVELRADRSLFTAERNRVLGRQHVEVAVRINNGIRGGCALDGDRIADLPRQVRVGEGGAGAQLPEQHLPVRAEREADFDAFADVHQQRRIDVLIVAGQRHDRRWIEHGCDDPDEIEEDHRDGCHDADATEPDDACGQPVNEVSASRKSASLGYIHDVLSGTPEKFRAASSTPGPRSGRSREYSHL